LVRSRFPIHSGEKAEGMKAKGTRTGQAKGPDGKPGKFKSVLKSKDKDHNTFQMFITGADGKESLRMTIDYTRKK
jgi:hypothetical protein